MPRKPPVDPTATQPLYPSRFRELKGAYFRRLNDDAIEVWREGACYHCLTPISFERFSCTCRDNREALFAKLIQKAEPAQPGYTTFHGVVSLCATCRQGYLENKPLREFPKMEMPLE